MKFKETKNGNVNVTLQYEEVQVLHAILGYVRLSGSENSDVVMKFLSGTDGYTDSFDLPDVSFSFSQDEGIVINV